MVSIFSHNDYKSFIREAIEALPKKGHGVRLRLAEELGCQSSYISQVLNGSVHFSFEQLLKVGKFFQLSEVELQYLMLLAQAERAGTAELRSFYRKEIDRILKEGRKMKSRIQESQPLSLDQQVKYFSAWHYAAIHVLLTIPGFRDKEAIRDRLHLPITVVNDALDFLQSAGLVLVEKGEFRPTNTRIFIDDTSPFQTQLHQNWRHAAIMRMDHASPKDMHYSTAVTLSENDYEVVRELLLKTITSIRERIRDSKEEKLCSFCVDFYEL